MFSFGKHKGKSFEEVADSDEGYARWALKQAEEGTPGGGLGAFITFLQETNRGAEAANGGRGPPRLGIPSTFSPQAPGGRGPSELTPQKLPWAGPGQGGEEFSVVCELVGHRHFAVRGERPASDASVRAGTVGGSCFLPSNVYGTIKALPDARASHNGRSFLFPLARYTDVVEQLKKSSAGVCLEPLPPWVMELERRAKKGADKPAELDDSRLPEGLMPYQMEGVKYGVAHEGRCLVGDEMGLGKSFQALAIAAQYTQDWPVLIVCPSSLRWVWKEQAVQWLSNLVTAADIQVVKQGKENLRPEAAIWIVSYALLTKEKFQQRPDGKPHGCVIADESHNIKEWQAARTKACVPVLKKASRAMLLSGTPTRNAPDELHPQLCALLPMFRVKLQDFRARYCVEQKKQVFGGRTVSKIVGARNAAELHHLLTSHVMIRRLKKDVLHELPPKRRQKVPIEASEKEMKEVRQQFKQLNSDFSAGDEAVTSLFRKTALAKMPAVREYLADVLERGDEKFIVFAYHIDVMDEIGKSLGDRLTAKGLSLMRIDGSVPAQKRGELVKKFQEDPLCRVALLSITACSEGITLTAAGLVIFAELYWVPGIIEQAEARAHRIGTTHAKVVVEFLVVPGSPDEEVYKRLDRKKQDTSNVLDGAKESLGAEDRALKRPRRAGIFAFRAKENDMAAAGAPAPAAPAPAAPSKPETRDEQRRAETCEERAKVAMFLAAARARRDR